MLDEIICASKTKSLQNIKTPEWDKNLKQLPNVQLFKICVAADSPFVDDLMLMPQDSAGMLRKYEESYGFSFPCFNFPSCLLLSKEMCEFGFLKLQDQKAAAEIAALPEKKRANPTTAAFKKVFVSDDFVAYLKALASQKDDGTMDWRGIALNKIGKCIKATEANLWTKLEPVWLTRGNPNYTLLHERLQNINAEAFWCGCFEYLTSQLDSFEAWELYTPLIAAGGGSGSAVYLDIRDYDDRYSPVAHENTIKKINGALFAFNDSDRKGVSSSEKDAYGEALSGWDAKMPSVNVGPLGPVILRSMVKETPCQFRYGTADFESFPVGDASRRSAKQALETLSQERFRGKTWDVLAYKELIFAYPVMLTKDLGNDCDEEYDEIIELPELPMTQSFTGDGIDDDRVDFESLAGQVIESLKGMSRQLSTIEIKVFVLRKMDKARTKVSYYTNFTAEHFYKSAREWSAGCHNLPSSLSTVKVWGKERGEVLTLDRGSIFPKDLNIYANKIWKRDASENRPSKRIKSMDGMELLLRNDIPCTVNLLSVFISYIAPLFGKIGAENCKGNSAIKKDERDKIADPAILALLLYKLGYKKEDYMKSSVYKLGTILALADSLQYQYCKYIRTSKEDRKNGRVNAPVQLVGNSMLVVAETSTRTVLGLLGRRIYPYLTWAKTDQDDGMRLSRWMIGQYNLLCKDFELSELPQRLSPIEKSELYLGYMAGVSGKSSDEITKTEGGE